MKQTKIMMGMPVTVEIVGDRVVSRDLAKVFNYFQKVDNRYSTYKEDSEISRINNGLPKSRWSREMKQVLDLCEQTKQLTDGYFDIEHDGKIDPSGLVKGWAINNAAKLIGNMGYTNYYVDAGGDIQVSGQNSKSRAWRIGIRNPFNRHENVKIIDVSNQGIATSGTYIRGDHIYNPKSRQSATEVASITVIGPDIYNADRFATAAFVMGENGINFIEGLDGYEAYMIKKDKSATMTSRFDKYIAKA